MKTTKGQRAIIIGATSGIGKALAEVMARQGYLLGLAGRRSEVLAELQAALPTTVHTRVIDVSRHEEAMGRLQELIAELGGLDVIVLSSGIGSHNPELTWPPEQKTIDVNVLGFVAMANVAYHYFRAQGGGHLVGISSIAAIRGSRWAPSYAASKAFITNYMEGLRGMARHAGFPLYVTDIRPGFVDTPLTTGQSYMFWVASAEKAARQIAQAIRQKRRHAYITHRWTLVAWLLRLLPEWLVERA